MPDLPAAELPDPAPPADPAPPPPLPTPLRLEFALDPEAVARLVRHPAILGARAGRSRTAAEEVLWLDTPDGALAATGVVLEAAGRPAARARPAPQAVRTHPAPGEASLPGMPPGAPPPVVAPADAVAFAAFAGRRTATALLADGEAVTALLREGKLRTVAAERPVARLLLEGPDAAALGLARRLAADLPLLPAGASLAECGRALARGEAPRPRRRGAPDLTGEPTVGAALAHAIGHLLDVLLHHAPACRGDAGPEGVHQARVALRRLRSALRTFKPAAKAPEVSALDRGLRDLARLLGPARDLDVFLAGLGGELAGALGEDRRIAALLRAAEARRAAAYAELRASLDGPGFRLLLLDGIAVARLRPWERPREDADPALVPGWGEALVEFAGRALDQRWHVLRSGGDDIEAHSAEALHDLRLEAKRLRYACELFAGLWPGKATKRFERRLAAVQDTLGHANDATVARTLVAGLGGGVPAWAVGAAEGFAAARAGSGRDRALRAWRKLEKTRPFWGD